MESSAKKFIFFSSVKAAADSVVGDVLTEDVIPTPVGPYGESKIKAEEYIKNHLCFQLLLLVRIGLCGWKREGEDTQE